MNLARVLDIGCDVDAKPDLCILFKGSGGDVGRPDVMASMAIDGTDLRSAAGEDYPGGWHPRQRPTSK